MDTTQVFQLRNVTFQLPLRTFCFHNQFYVEVISNPKYVLMKEDLKITQRVR